MLTIPSRSRRQVSVVLWAALILPTGLLAQSRARARDLGIPLEGTPGRYNAITDVAGVEVGATTLIEGSGRLVVGRGPVRTGVTAIFPRAGMAPTASSPAGSPSTATAR